MKISPLLTDDAILAELGERMARRRLDLQLTQADVAGQAGIAKRTVERIEAGASAQMSSIIRILRVLELLPDLDVMIPEATVRPMDLLKRKGKVRQRATSRSRADRPEPPWSWDDDA
ncbi:MAG: helix-turn-helix transcriptional regulator [Gammaproteobacteria bacterium]|jgi:transcriptional regulator with XRE-family HTH domain